MPRKPKNEDDCPICGQYMEVIVSAYRDAKFIDGRNYDYICDTCNTVPKMYSYDEATDTLPVFDEMDPKRLCTVEEIMADGWEKKEAQASLKAVKASIRKYKKKT